MQWSDADATHNKHQTPNTLLPYQAEARQRQFEQSAVGRAAIKSVAEAKRRDERETARTTAADWQS